jgi:hypothetical protein
MNVPMVIAGAEPLGSPLSYRYRMGKARARIEHRPGQPEHFDRTMNRPHIRAIVAFTPIGGVLVTVLAVIGK